MRYGWIVSVIGLGVGCLLGCQRTLMYVRFPAIWPASVSAKVNDRAKPLEGLQEYALLIEPFAVDPEALQEIERPVLSESPLTTDVLTDLASRRLASDGWRIAGAENTGPVYRLHCTVHKLGYMQQGGWPVKTTAEGLMSCELREANGAIRWMRTFRRTNEERSVINTLTKLPPQDPNRFHQVVVDACVDEMIDGLSTSLRGFIRAHLEVARPTVN